MVNEINNVKVNNIYKSENTSGVSSSSTSSDNSIFSKEIDKIIELAEKLHITKEQVQELTTKYPEFLKMDINQQVAIVNNESAKKVVSTKENATNANDITNITQNEAVVEDVKNNESDSQDPLNYDFKSYSQLSNEEKVNAYVTELAKNKYMFSSSDNKKTLEDWNALSEEEKNRLIKKEYSSFAKDNSQGLYDKDDVSLYLDKEMTKLQAASYLGVNIEEFAQREPKYINESIHDYLHGCLDENLSENQVYYKESQYVLSKAVVKACKESGDNTYVDGVEYILAPVEISSVFSEGGVLAGQTRIDVQMKYLQDKLNKGIALDEKEQAVYDRLNKLVNSVAGKAYLEAVKYKAEHPNERVNYGRLDALKKSEYGEDYETALNDADKRFVLESYITKVTKNLSTDEKAKFINELILEVICNNDDAEFTANVYSDIIKASDENTQDALMKSKSDIIPELNVLNADIIESDNVLRSLAITQEEMLEEDPERAEMLASSTMDNLSNEKLLAVSSVYSASKSENIQSKHADKAITLKINSDEDVYIQRVMLGNGENSSLNVRKAIATRLDEVHEKNQIPLTEKFIKDKEVAKAMNKDGTLARFHKDNQVSGFELLKNRFESNDFSKNEAISQLNQLSDQIQNCDKDNQLAIHNDIMGSKYKEVQEHAAGNIGNYDPAVQSEAMESVYASGNQAAVEEALNNVGANTNPVIKDYIQDEIGIPDMIKSALQDKIRSGEQLTPEEYSSLSYKEKIEYQANYFKNLSPVKQIKLLASISNSNQKKTIYQMIMNNNGALFQSIIESSADTAKFIYNNIDSAKSLVKQVAMRKAASDISFNELLKEINSDEEKQQPNIQNNTANKHYISSPEDLGINGKNPKYEIYPKDRYGNILS